MQLKKWKNPHKFQRIMMASGCTAEYAHQIWMRMNRWQSVRRKEVMLVLNLQWFNKRGLISLHQYSPSTLTP